MSIRLFSPEDAPALAAIFHAAVHELARGDYAQAQLAAWSPGLPDPAGFIARAADGRAFLVAVDTAGEPMAYGDLEADGHLDHLYCRPDVAGSGIASAIYDRLEAEAVARGLDFLFVEASETARPLFQRKGFVVEERRELRLNGITLHNYRMTKSL